MTTNLHLPLALHDPRPPAFPPRCVGCGAAPVAESRMLLQKLVTRGQKQEQVSLTLLVPHCQRCARATKSVFMAGCLPFIGGGLLVGLAVFVSVFILAARAGLDEMTDGEEWPSLILAAAAGLFAGILGGFVIEIAARLLLLPFMGTALLRAPLLAAQLLNDSDYVAGLSARLNRDATQLELRFERDEAAQTFAGFNQLAVGNKQ
jgi:hypothetical protein